MISEWYGFVRIKFLSETFAKEVSSRNLHASGMLSVYLIPKQNLNFFKILICHFSQYISAVKLLMLERSNTKPDRILTKLVCPALKERVFG